MGNSCCHDNDVVHGQSQSCPPTLRLSVEQLNGLFELGQQRQRAQMQMQRAQMQKVQMQMAQRYQHQLQLAAARVQQLEGADARRQQMEQQESNRRSSLAQEPEQLNERENQAQIAGQVNVTRFTVLSIEDGQLRLRQITNVQIMVGDNDDCASEPSSSELAIEPPPSIRELLTFNAALAPGTSILMTMDFDETLNDLAQKLQESRGYRLRDITVEGNKFTVNQHGEYSLTDLGVGKLSKVVCNSR